MTTLTQHPQASTPNWRLSRAPLFRLCTLRLRCASFPDEGAGVWQVVGYENLNTKDEAYQLRRVQPGRKDGPTGEIIHVWRHHHDNGYLRIWLQNPEDPELNTDVDAGQT